MPVGPHSEKFNIVSNDHGLSQKCDFFVSIGETNFTDHHTPATINGFRHSVLVCKMHDCCCTICKNFEHFHLQCLDYMKTNHFKMLLNISSTTYTMFSLISVGPQISAAPLGIHTEISTSL